MGLLTQLIAQKHDTDTRDKANQIGIWKNILDDQSGQYTADMKQHALGQMMDMAEGKKPGSKAGAGGDRGGMMGVFQHLLGMGGGGDQGKGGLLGALQGNRQGAQQPQSMQQAVAPPQMAPQMAPQSTPGSTPLPDGSGAMVPNPVANATGATPLPDGSGQNIPDPSPLPNRQPIAPPVLPPMSAPGVDSTGAPVNASRIGEGGILSPQERLQIQQGISNQTIDGRLKKYNELVSAGTDKRTAASLMGLPIPPLVHNQGAPINLVDGEGKHFVRTYDTVGGHYDDYNAQKATPVPNGKADDGLKYMPKPMRDALVARRDLTSDDPLVQQSAKEYIQNQSKNAENQVMDRDLKTRLAQTRIASMIATNDPNTAKSIADGIERGGGDPTLAGLSRKMGDQVTAILQQRGFNHANAKLEYRATNAHLSAMNSNQQLAMGEKVQTAYDSLPLVEHLADNWEKYAKLGNSNPTLNHYDLKLAAQGKLAGYSPEAQKAASLLITQVHDVQGEIASVLMGSSAPTDKALILASGILDSDWPIPIMREQLKQIKLNLDRRAEAMAYARTSGIRANSPYGTANVGNPVTTGANKTNVASTPTIDASGAPSAAPAKTMTVQELLDRNTPKKKGK